MTATFAEEPGCNYFLFWGELFWEETEYESRQKIQDEKTVLQFMFEAASQCTILGFLFTNCDPNH